MYSNAIFGWKQNVHSYFELQFPSSVLIFKSRGRGAEGDRPPSHKSRVRAKSISKIVFQKFRIICKFKYRYFFSCCMYCSCSQVSNLNTFSFYRHALVVNQWSTFIVNQDTAMVDHGAIGRPWFLPISFSNWSSQSK